MKSPVVPKESNHAAFLLGRYLSEGPAHKSTVHYDRESLPDEDRLRGDGKTVHDLPRTASGNAAWLAARFVKRKLFAFVAEKLLKDLEGKKGE